MKEKMIRALSRRNFLMKLGVGMGSLAGLAVMIPFAGAFLAPLLKKKSEKWRVIGKVGDFETGTTSLVEFINADPEPYAGLTAKSAAWIRKESDGKFTAFSANCSHLGCPVRWEKNAELFMCPCHGGVYYKDGSVAAGPPPKGLTKYSVKVENGEVRLLTSPMPITSLNASKK